MRSIAVRSNLYRVDNHALLGITRTAVRFVIPLVVFDWNYAVGK